jgi:hypothetical protein
MNENGAISRDELRFVYGLILQGRTDPEILDAYIFLRDRGQLEFPFRREDNFFRDRRREMEVAADVLWENIEKMVRPFMSDRKDGHAAQIADVAASLLENNLDTVLDRRAIKRRPRVYSIMGKNNVHNFISERELLHIFRKNAEAAIEKYGADFFYKCYVVHLKAEVPGMGAEGFWPYAENHPYAVIQKIKEQRDGDGLKGECPLCNDGQAHLPPLLRRMHAMSAV